MFLVDTNVLSAGAPSKSPAFGELVDWMDRNSAQLYLSVIIVAEVEDGIAKARREGATRKADRIAEWLGTVRHLYSSRILPLDLVIARAVGALSDRARGQGEAPGFADLAIAATARCFGYVVLTRNLRHFRQLDVAVHDPFAALPSSLR